MHKRKSILLLGVLLLIAIVIAAIPAGSAQGDEESADGLIIGDTPPDVVTAIFVDSDTSTEYNIHLVAKEDDFAGHITMFVQGSSLGFCTARGSDVNIDFSLPDPNPSPLDADYGGNLPLADISCGTAYGMEVDIDECEADFEFHGYLHSDYPNIVYTGMMTADVSFEKDDNPDKNEVKITLHTPKGKMKLKGIVDGDVVMDTCQAEED